MTNQGVFIGLGGAGVYSTGHLKARLLKAAGKDKDRLRESCRFIFIDTDNRAYNRINALYAKEFNGQKLIDEDWVPFSDIAPKYHFRQAVSRREQGNLDDSQKVLLSFVDEKSAASFKNGRLEEGASANRQQGRVALWVRWREVQGKINECIEDLKSPNNSVQSALSIPFYILSGTCGGTGSSMFLDVAYLLDRTAKTQFKEREPIVRAVLFMPEWYVQQYRKDSNDSIVRKYQSNAYAFFEEVNYFLADYHAGEDAGLGEKFGEIFVAPEIDDQVEGYNRKWGIFNFAICIDSTSELEGKLDDKQMYQNTAEMLYHWHRSEVQGEFVSSFDNQLREQYLGEQRVPAFITMGYRALEYPGDLLTEYCTTRFLYEFFSHGLLDDDGAGAREYLRSDNGRGWLAGVLGGIRGMLSAGQENGRRALLSDTRNAIRGALHASFAYQNGDSTAAQLRKRLRQWRGRTNTSYDPAKVGDDNTLNQFTLSAERSIRSTAEALAQDFNGAGGDSVQAKLTSHLVASVEHALEEAFMAFGLDGAHHVAQQLANGVKRMEAECHADRESQSATLRRLEAEIGNARTKCLNEQDDNCLASLAALYEQKLAATHGLTDAEQRGDLLRTLVGGTDPAHGRQQSGVLAAYVEALASMRREVRNRLLSSSGGGGGSISYAYHQGLKERLSLLRDTITTAYLPNVTELVRNGEYVNDHPFSKTYAALVPQAGPDGGPIRRAPYEKLWGDPSGLHALMIEMFQRAAGSGGDGDDARRPGESIFRRYLTAPASEHRLMAEEFETAARRAIESLLEQKGGRRGRSIEEAFNALSPEERDRIKQNFIDRAETFCKMDESLRSKPLDVTLYVGHSRDLAASLGYSDGAGAQFIETPDQSRFLLIKAKALWTVDQYPFYEQYRLIYDARRRISYGSEALFSPHIHKLFNELGVADGMRRLLRPSADLDVYLLMLLYDRMFRVAQKSFYPLFKEVVHWDGAYQGEQATKPSPLAWATGSDGTKVVQITEEIGSRGGKLLFEQGSFKVIVPYRNLQQLFNKLAGSHPRLFTKLQRVDDVFRQIGRREWAAEGGPLARAYREVEAMFTPRPPEGQKVAVAVMAWFDGARNRLHDLHAELTAHVLNQQGTAGPFDGAPSDDYEPDLPHDLPHDE